MRSFYALARARSDFLDGLSQDENPFRPGTLEHKTWKDEMAALHAREDREQQAHDVKTPESAILPE